MPLNFNKAEFVRSAGEPKDFLRDGLPQFAFAGRSNVGKSSVINRLVGRKNLAYVGASPGKTTHINYFLIDQKAYLVDLPGYGYAKVSRSEKERWARLMETYFQRKADAITTGVLIVDIRHKPTENDLVMHDWFRQSGCPEIVVANKLDKLKKSQVEPALEPDPGDAGADGGGYSACPFLRKRETAEMRSSGCCWTPARAENAANRTTDGIPVGYCPSVFLRNPGRKQ